MVAGTTMPRWTLAEPMREPILDRRQLMMGVGFGFLAYSLPARAISFNSAPVCALHDGNPYLDRSGRVRAYQPPHGIRGAECLALLDEAALRHVHFYL